MAVDSVELPGDQGEGVIAQAPADEVLDVLPPEVLVASVGGGLVGVLETAAAGALDGIPVQPQIKGTRELVAGIIRDPSSARA